MFGSIINKNPQTIRKNNCLRILDFAGEFQLNLLRALGKFRAIADHRSPGFERALIEKSDYLHLFAQQLK